jgi:Arc/MetJ-type ribon-helix-helix transcriptional regulator
MMKGGVNVMHLEIHKPELEQRVRQQIQSGQFKDADELLTKALDALEEKTSAIGCAEGDATGAALLAVLQESPYPEIDLAPRRERVPTPVRDVVL